jgi:hypothetical protein
MKQFKPVLIFAQESRAFLATIIIRFSKRQSMLTGHGTEQDRQVALRLAASTAP